MITAVVDVLLANGNSAVPTDPDGTKPVKVVQLGAGLIVTYTRSGDLAIVGVAVDPAFIATLLTPVYVSARIATGTSGGGDVFFTNDGATTRTVTAFRLIALQTITQSDTDYWTIGIALGSAPNSALVSMTTKVTGGSAIAAGTPITMAGTVAVPSGDSLILRMGATGSPSSLGIMVQGR